MTERAIKLNFSVQGATIEELDKERDAAIKALLLFPKELPVHVTYQWSATPNETLRGESGVVTRVWEADVEAFCKWDETDG